MMRRVAAAIAGALVVVSIALLMSGPAAAQAGECSAAPCDAAATDDVFAPVVVRGTPSGVAPEVPRGVFESDSTGVVEPFAVLMAGMVAMVAVLGVAVRARRVALTAALSAPVACLEPAQEH